MLHFGVDEKYWKSARSRSRQATSATPQRCPTCWRKFHRIKRSTRPPALGPMTRVDAIIPPRKNAQLWQASNSWRHCTIAPNEALRACKYLEQALWRKLTGYHRQSRAEKKMNCVKLLGPVSWPETAIARLLRSRSTPQCLTAFGMPVTESGG